MLLQWAVECKLKLSASMTDRTFLPDSLIINQYEVRNVIITRALTRVLTRKSNVVLICELHSQITRYSFFSYTCYKSIILQHKNQIKIQINQIKKTKKQKQKQEKSVQNICVTQ